MRILRAMPDPRRDELGSPLRAAYFADRCVPPGCEECERKFVVYDVAIALDNANSSEYGEAFYCVDCMRKAVALIEGRDDSRSFVT